MKEKFKVTKNLVATMGGLCFILFAFVTLFSRNTPFGFLSNVITVSFGFVGFWLFLPFIVVVGLYLVFNKAFLKLKLGVPLWGLFIIIVCFLVLSSHWASWDTVYNGIEIVGKGRTDTGTPKYLTFSNAVPIFNEINKETKFLIGPSTRLGGGQVGFILAGAINSAVTPVGLNIISWFFFCGGLMMVLDHQIVKIFAFLKARAHRIRQPKIKIEEEEPESSFSLLDQINTPVEPVKQETPVFDNKPIFESFHTSAPINNEYDLRKARFVLPGDEKNEPEQSSICKPAFEQISEPTIENNLPESNDPLTITSEEPKKVYSEPFFEPLLDENKIEEKQPEPAQFIEPEPNNVVQAQPEPAQQPVQEEKPVDFEHQGQPKAHLIKNYIYPSIDLLDVGKSENNTDAIEESCMIKTDIINKTLRSLGVGAEVISHTIGPSVTRYDLQTNEDVSVNAVQKYISDISVRLNGTFVRYEAIVPGKSTSGLEIPNDIKTNVTLREAIEALPDDKKHLLNIPFGKSISGEVKFANMADFPHMLVAGTTGSGKSIFVHSTIITLLMKTKPEELKLVMIDPKKVEMNYYEDIPHLLCPVISDSRKAFVAMQKLVSEMERRYNLFQSNKVRDIKGFNEYAKMHDLQPLPFIVVFIDEYADLVDTCKEIREPVVRIVQKARAAGIHMVLATQRPSVNVIDGVIKANVATRVALMCASAVDSQTVIGEGGAEKLLGYGDMLIECSLLSRTSKPRVQGCYVSEIEIMRICDFLREHYQPQFDPMYLNLEPVVEEKQAGFDEPEATPIDKEKTDEEAYQVIKEDARHREYFSISYITRTYSMGYSRAGKMFKRLQNEGIVAQSGDARGCKVLVYVPGEQQYGGVEQSTVIPDDGTN